MVTKTKCRNLENSSGVLTARPSHSSSECWLETINDMSGFKLFFFQTKPKV